MVFYYTESDLLIMRANTMRNGTCFSGAISSEQVGNSTLQIGVESNIHDTFFFVFTGTIGVLLSITTFLLLHLCFFHLYISFRGLTTYEYIRNQRQNVQNRAKVEDKINSGKSPMDSLQISEPKQIFICSTIDSKVVTKTQNSKYQRTIHCCNQTLQYNKSSHSGFYLCSVVHDRPPLFLMSSTRYLTENNNDAIPSKTFHCCSEYEQIISIDGRIPDHEENLNRALNLSESDRNYTVQYTEICTLCSFKLRTVKRFEFSNIKCHQHQKCHRTTFHFIKEKWGCCFNDAKLKTNSSTLRTISENINQQEIQNSSLPQHSWDSDYSQKRKVGNNSISSLYQTKPCGLKNANIQCTFHKRTRATNSNQRLQNIFKIFDKCQQSNIQFITEKHSKRIKSANFKQNKIHPESDQNSERKEGIERIGYSEYEIRSKDFKANSTISNKNEPYVIVDSKIPPTHHHHYPSRIIKHHKRTTIKLSNRRRRKPFFITRSPKLSPIHESEFSNPASPLPNEDP